jgi:hypothetical protein
MEPTSVFKILLSLVSLAGEPIGIVEGLSERKFDTMAACVQAAPDEISKLTAFIKKNRAGDQFIVGMAMCWNSGETEHSEPIWPDKTKMETPTKSGEKDI